MLTLRPQYILSVKRTNVLVLPIGDAIDAKHIRTLAVRALYEELVTYPKPGLVSLVDAGSHRDMDAPLFVRSAFALRGSFERLAAAGREGEPFAALRRIGVDAEARMLCATRGVNTHRGAIFVLGLLAAAAGARSRPAHDVRLDEVVRREWGQALESHRRDPASHGSRATALSRSSGALAEAQAGFPSVFEVALPAYRTVLAAGASANAARVHAFFALLSRVDDTNLLHRGGPAALAFAREMAADFLARGGVLDPGWRERAIVAHRAFCVRRLSPGGSADLLAACIFVHSLPP